MRGEREHARQSSLTHLMTTLLGFPWIEIIAESWKLGRKIVRGLTDEGMFEVLDYESTLELHDKNGKRATFRKSKKVRYLQNNIIAYPDYAWGDGEILLDYKCSPGEPVDRYRSGHKTYLLLSLREIKNRGDEDEFNIQRDIRDGFLRSEEQWETEISHPTDYLKIRLLFPKDRYPKRVVVLESDRQRSQVLPSASIRTLPDGRCQVTWEQTNPRLHERYILKWAW